MIFSMKELQKIGYLEKDLNIDKLVNAINSIGFEVEEIIKFNHVKNLKYGKVLEISKNPNDELLNACKIEFNDKVRIIQTVAKNVEVGKYIIAFTPGSQLDKTTIASKELKGMISEGMLCGISEFGFKSNLLDPIIKDEVIILAEANLNGDPIEDLFLNDYLIDISILSNRSDANSYYVMSQEIAAYFNTFPQNSIQTTIPDLLFDKKIHFSEDLLGFFSNKNDFSLNLIQQILLLKSGIKITRSIEDFINFFVLQSGMPFQILDSSKLSNLVIEKNEGSTININNNTYNSEDIYLLKNNDDIVGIPNIYIDKKYEITKETKDILFLFSFLKPKNVRQMNKIFKLDNLVIRQSCKNLAKGLSNKTYKILFEYGFVNSNFNKMFITKELKFVDFNIECINKIAGFKITEQKLFDEVLDKLRFLGFIFNLNSKKVYIPEYRSDIENIYDIAEEIFRFYGYTNFNPKSLNTTALKIKPLNNIKYLLVAKGYSETRSYTLINQNKNIFNPFSFKKNISLLTFTSEDRSIVRNSQLESILEIIEYNQKRRIQEINIFDIGMINKGVISLILATNTKNFHDLKHDIFTLFNKEFTLERISNNKQFNQYNSAYLKWNNKIIGWIGMPNLHDYDTDCLFVEILLDKIVIDTPKTQVYTSEPLKIRDLTFSVKNNDISSSIDEYLNLFKEIKNIYSTKIKDKYLKNDLTNITIRFMVDANSIKQFEEIIKIHNLG